MPDPTGLELIAHELREHVAGSVADTQYYRGVATLVVNPERSLDVLRWLRDAPAQRYTFLSSLHGADYLPHEPRFGVHYELLNLDRIERIHVKALLADPGDLELPEIDSCIEIFPSADFQEREVYDMFGVRFRGHPDLRRILMPEDYEGFPQRRDFPLGGEPVLFTHNEHELPRWYE
jgi:NADH-quinone oxidoreductase subunit C